MQYRELGNTGKKLSLLSFGGMRIPRVSVKASIEVIKKAYQLGINFFETAPGYGNSEHKIGLALKEIDRSKVYISTKSSPESDNNPEALRKRLEQSLEKLKLNYIDFYQIWGINTEEHYDIVFKKNGVLQEARQAQKEGLIHHLGFTSHAKPPLILKTMATKEFDSVTFIYHLFNQKNHPVLAKAQELNMGTIIITPLSQGMLAHPTPIMQKDFSPYDVRDYSLKWLANDNRISTIASGMKTLKELNNNYNSIHTFKPFSQNEYDLANCLFDVMKKRSGQYYCSECGDCLPCPKNINIPELLRLNNLMTAYQTDYYCKDRYKFTGNAGHWYPGAKANHCDECNKCLPGCPEKLPITQLIKKLHEQLYTGERGPLSNH